VQVNRPLRAEFTRVLDRTPWDVALLQEAPPRWRESLARDLRAESACTLTARNSLGRLRGALARVNPDLVASNEGGSNQLLVRAPWRIEEVREHVLAERPERRTMLWARLTGPGGGRLAVANLHGTLPGAPVQVLDAAALAVDWAGAAPLRFGGAPPTGPDAIDHLLARGLDVVRPPRRARDSEREVDGGGGRAIRLSDHAQVTCAVGMR
jgi:endonuclease/exonuclease/phosphatase family metal-dependent hydrolase